MLKVGSIDKDGEACRVTVIYDAAYVAVYSFKAYRERGSISFNKILVCNQEWSKDYDFIVFIDADILINVNAPPIHSHIDYGECIGIIDEYSQPSKERRLKIQRQMGWEKSAVDYYKLCGLDIQTDMVQYCNDNYFIHFSGHTDFDKVKSAF